MIDDYMIIFKLNIKLTAPVMLKKTANNLEIVKRSPIDDGKIAAKPSVKKLEVVLKRVTNAVSLGPNANWNM